MKCIGHVISHLHTLDVCGVDEIYRSVKLHGYTVHQQCWTLLLPTDAHNVKKHRVIKTF